MSTTTPRPAHRRRVNMTAIVLAAVLGVVMAAAAAVSGRIVLGLVFLAIMWGLAAFLLIGSRYSDTVALLGDDTREERHVHIHQRAALYTLNILALAIIVGFVVDIVRGGSGEPYALMGFVGGLVYLACLLVLSRRS